jgi:hypothetical protein
MTLRWRAHVRPAPNAASTTTPSADRDSGWPSVAGGGCASRSRTGLGQAAAIAYGRQTERARTELSDDVESWCGGGDLGGLGECLCVGEVADPYGERGYGAFGRLRGVDGEDRAPGRPDIISPWLTSPTRRPSTGGAAGPKSGSACARRASGRCPPVRRSPTGSIRRRTAARGSADPAPTTPRAAEQVPRGTRSDRTPPRAAPVHCRTAADRSTPRHRNRFRRGACVPRNSGWLEAMILGLTWGNVPERRGEACL